MSLDLATWAYPFADHIAESDRQAGKMRLVRIVAMLTRMMGSLERAEPDAVYGYEYEYEYGRGAH